MWRSAHISALISSMIRYFSDRKYSKQMLQRKPNQTYYVREPYCSRNNVMEGAMGSMELCVSYQESGLRLCPIITMRV
jgi:hypothetical protein